MDIPEELKSKDLVAFLAVLLVIAALFGAGKLSEQNFLKVLLIILGGFLGWGLSNLRNQVRNSDS